MDLKDQCCTREQGARLVELGVKPLATFYHMPAKDGPHGEYIQYGWHGDNLAPAFTVAELGDILPKTILPSGGISYSWYHRNNWRGHSVGYHAAGANCHIERGWFESEAQARADLIIHLLENNHMELPEQWKEDSDNPCHGGNCKRSYSPDMEEILPLPAPSYHEREMPVFNAVWAVLKGCTIQMPKYFKGYQEVNGCHVKLIADAIDVGKHDDNTVPGA